MMSAFLYRISQVLRAVGVLASGATVLVLTLPLLWVALNITFVLVAFLSVGMLLFVAVCVAVGSVRVKDAIELLAVGKVPERRRNNA